MINLMQGDCLERMKEIPDGSVDMILTDPPYGNMDTDGGRKMGIVGWDQTISHNSMLDRCNRILRTNGAMALFSQQPYTTELISKAHGNLPFSYLYTWKKDNFANPLNVNKAPVNYTEDVCVFFKKHTKHDFKGHHPLREYAREIMSFINMNLKQINTDLGHRRAEHFFYVDSTQFGLCTEKTYKELMDRYSIQSLDSIMFYDEMTSIDRPFRENLIKEMTARTPKIFNLEPGKKYKSNVLEYRKDYGGLHPTQKPVALLEDLIKTYTNEGDTVLDFTMGSGSTGVAAKNLNRNFIGIEMDETYFNIAKDRISQS